MAKNAQKPEQANFLRRNLLTVCLSISFIVLVIFSLPSVMVIIFALLPTFVAFIVDNTPEKNSVFCIGSLNLCGVLPYLIDLWTGDNSMNAAILILTDVFSLVVMYGAAAFGWMIFQSLPPFIATFITVLAQSRVSSLRSSQRKLVEEWGDIVIKVQDTNSMPDRLSNEANGDTIVQPSSKTIDTTKPIDDVKSAFSETKAS